MVIDRDEKDIMRITPSPHSPERRDLQHATMLLLDQMLVTSLTIAMEMLTAADTFRRVKQKSRQPLTMKICSRTSSMVNTHGQIPILPNCRTDQIEQTDLIVVPALWRNPKRVIEQERATIDWLKRHYQQGATLVAVGTGVCLLAEAGILDGKAATTHWHYLDQFAADYPKVQLQRQHLLTQANRIYCAASVNSGADLIAHVIGRSFGAEIGQLVEQQFSPEVRIPVDKQLLHSDQPSQHNDEEVAIAQDYLRQHLREPLAINALAAEAGLSVRQFHRRFNAVTGMTPSQYQQQLRHQLARELLKESNLAIHEIAHMVGYADTNLFGRHFRRQAGQSPSDYRQKVRSKLFT